MPPHDGDHGPGHDHEHPHDDEKIDGLPVRHRWLRPGSIHTGALIVAALAVVAQARAGLLPPAAVSFDDGFFGRPHLPDAPLGEAWTSLERALAGSYSRDLTRGTNLILHAFGAALAYVFFANVTKRKLGAPMIAAALYAVHPLAGRAVGSINDRGSLSGAVCAFFAGILFLRSPGDRRLLWTSAAVLGVGLFADPTAVALPLVLVCGLLAYHGVEWTRLGTPRLRKRLAVLLLPVLGWAVAAWMLPQREWLVERPLIISAGSEFGPQTITIPQGSWWFRFGHGGIHALGEVLLPDSLRSIRTIYIPETVPPFEGWVGFLAVLSCAVLGARLLRRHVAGFPLLAFVLCFVAWFQFGAAAPLLPLAFAMLLAAEGLEHLYYRWGGRGLAPTLIVIGLLGVLSWL